MKVVKIGKIEFNIDLISTLTKTQFKEMYKKQINVDHYWDALSKHFPKVSKKKS